jgi:Flp pilus assembly protein TadD
MVSGKTSPPGRNDPCPCGSGRKFKACCLTAVKAPGGRHGATAASPAAKIGDLIHEARSRFRAGDLASARRIYQQALMHDADNASALGGLGAIAGRSGELTEAIRLLRASIEKNPGECENHSLLSEFLLQDGQATEALEAARGGVSAAPRDPRCHVMVGICLSQMHREDEAVTNLNAALALAPGHPHALLALAAIDRRRGDLSAAIDRSSRVARAPGIEAATRREALLEYGLALDAAKKFSDAYTAFEEAGVIMRLLPTTRAMLARPWRAMLENFRTIPAELIRSKARLSQSDDRRDPAFLVGFFRSGTTMIEQVLASHPDIVAIGERPLVSQLVQRLAALAPAKGTLTEMIDCVSADDISRLRTAYWDDAARAASTNLAGKVLVDKLPLNILALGVINVIFPSAKVIVALRDPRDVCLSCIMQLFRVNEVIAHFHSLESTAMMYDAVMGAYLELKDRLTVPTLSIRYEDTVENLEHQARRILEFLGVPWDDRVLAFHETARRRTVVTPSFAAVAEKVYTRARGRWRNYEFAVRTVAPVLSRYVREFGYDE